MKKISVQTCLCLIFFLVHGLPLTAQSVITLFSQDFENPSENPPQQTCAADLSQRPVNFLYGNDYQQIFTVETIRINGAANYYTDTSGIGGDYCLGMLCCANDDRLGFKFDTQQLGFLNVFFDMSTIGASGCGVPFFPGVAPQLEVAIVDNPGGALPFGNGTVLDQVVITGTPTSAPNTFNWASYNLSLDATGSADGNVALRFDLLPSAGYIALDNFTITASTQPLPTVPALSQWGLILLGLLILCMGAIFVFKSNFGLSKG